MSGEPWCLRVSEEGLQEDREVGLRGEVVRGSGSTGRMWLKG